MRERVLAARAEIGVRVDLNNASGNGKETDVNRGASMVVKKGWRVD